MDTLYSKATKDDAISCGHRYTPSCLDNITPLRKRGGSAASPFATIIRYVCLVEGAIFNSMPVPHKRKKGILTESGIWRHHQADFPVENSTMSHFCSFRFRLVSTTKVWHRAFAWHEDVTVWTTPSSPHFVRGRTLEVANCKQNKFTDRLHAF